MNDSEDTEERCYVDLLQFCIFSEWPEQTISNPYILLGYIMHLLQEEQCLMFGDVTIYPSMCEVSEYFNKSVGETTMHSMQNSSVIKRFTRTRFSIIYS